MTMWKAWCDGTGKIVKRARTAADLAGLDLTGLTMVDFDDTIHDDRFWTLVGGVLTRNTSKELRIASTCVSADAQAATAAKFSAGLTMTAIAGLFYDNSFYPAGTSTLTGVANACDLAPWSTSGPIVIDQIGVAVATAVASTSVKIVIYGSDANGWPGALLYESAAIATIATGYQFVAVTNFAFKPGTTYWVGVRYNGAPVLRAIPVANCISLGLNGSNGVDYFTKLRRALTFANAAPSAWAFVSSELIANLMVPSVRFRAA
jgi:hypothetical protein